MASPEHAQLIAHGRAQQAAGHTLDAILCFLEAARSDPRAPDAHFHLGEVLWKLGRSADAIAAWREALHVDPAAIVAARALASALLAAGDAAGAADATAQVLARAPGDVRAEMIAGVAAMASRDGEIGNAARRVADALACDVSLLADRALAMPLAVALDRVPSGTAAEHLLDQIVDAAASAQIAPTLLLALACERAASAGDAGAAARSVLFRHAAVCGWEAADHDALRRIALAAARAVDAEAARLSQAYADLCATMLPPPLDPRWPRRTAGEGMRVVLLLPAGGPGAVPSPASALVRLPRDSLELTLATVGAADEDVVEFAAALGAKRVELPFRPDATAAKAVAVRDPDILVDLAGLGSAVGLLLAHRPARSVWTVSAVPHAHVAPLVDRTFADVDELVAALSRAARDPRFECPLPASTLAALWESAVRMHQCGDRVGARAGYARVLGLQPGYAPAHYLTGVLARDEGEATLALREFLASLASAPRYIEARIAAAGAATAMGDAATAVALCEEGIARTPANVALWRALGHAHLARRDGQAAATAFGRALALDPTDAGTHYNRGVALQMQGDLPEASRAYRHALAFAPDLTDANFNLGVICRETGAVDEAIVAYAKVLAANPRTVAAYKQLGDVLFAAARYDGWLENFRRFEANCPGALPLAVQALEVCQYQGDFGRVQRYLDGLRRGDFRPADEVELTDCLEELLYLLLFFDVEPAMIAQLARTYDATARNVYGEPLARLAARRPGRLRVGYLSADLRNHVMGKMMWQAIRHHDRSRFELFFYALSDTGDDWTARYRGVADRFEVIADLSERAAAERIAADDLDLLVDLSTHTKGARPGILALKPARVQITHVASAGTVGLSTVDFKLTDAYADVAGSQAHQIEALLPMEGCVYPYRHIAPAIDHPYHRDRMGVSADAIVIGGFVSVLKLSRRCLGLWREVLDRIPRALLAFSPNQPAARGFYLRIARAAGIPANRIIFVPQGRDDAENQARYGLVDFVLDPMPFGGVNGTLEALDMGVPVVTLIGKRHGERTAYSILVNLGVRETIAQTGREYVDIAVRLAGDTSFMNGVRGAIRAGLAASPLVDMPRHARALEAAYEAALAIEVSAGHPAVRGELRFSRG